MGGALADGAKGIKVSDLAFTTLSAMVRPMRERMRWALPIVALITSCGGAADKPETPAEPPARPALWKLSDADTTIYLFGTIHVLPDNVKWRTPKLNAAIRQSDELILEVADLGDRDKTADTFVRLGMSQGLPPALDRVPPDKRAGLQALIEQSKAPKAALDRFETWALAVTLAAGVLSTLDISPDNGVEKALAADFKAAKKPVAGLETTELQLSYFDTLPEATQRIFLVSMVDDAADAKTEFARMIRAWATGDEKAIALTFDDEAKLTKELTDVLLRNRNANWTAWIARRMDQPGTVMVAVGAGHLAGPDSVQTMLGARGIKVSRVQ